MVVQTSSIQTSMPLSSSSSSLQSSPTRISQRALPPLQYESFRKINLDTNGNTAGPCDHCRRPQETIEQACVCVMSSQVHRFPKAEIEHHPSFYNLQRSSMAYKMYRSLHGSALGSNSIQRRQVNSLLNIIWKG